ncbi:hypothetical protein [uncultured Paraglaciecola sp.]|uniref:hypothetical protein n=1 Tax=uncultured Paraglaciecola sp. TaxID=1765024 RepID=UPI002602018A|nr:hypothetical protein [uncultured Paraglaciecola sp.]
MQEIKPGRELYNHVRGGFVTKGSSLTEWCKKQGVNYQNATQCLTGSWDGPKAKVLRNKMIADSGIKVTSK